MRKDKIPEHFGTYIANWLLANTDHDLEINYYVIRHGADPGDEEWGWDDDKGALITLRFPGQDTSSYTYQRELNRQLEQISAVPLAVPSAVMQYFEEGEEPRVISHVSVEELHFLLTGFGEIMTYYADISVNELYSRCIMEEEFQPLIYLRTALKKLRFLPAGVLSMTADQIRMELNDEEIPLFDSLRELRNSIARTRGIAAYVVFGNQALWEISKKRPSTMTDLRKIRGIGEKTAESFGKEILQCVNSFK